MIHFPAERRLTLIQSHAFEAFINNSLEVDLFCSCLYRDRVKENHSHWMLFQLSQFLNTIWPPSKGGAIFIVLSGSSKGHMLPTGRWARGRAWPQHRLCPHCWGTVTQGTNGQVEPDIGNKVDPTASHMAKWWTGSGVCPGSPVGSKRRRGQRQDWKQGYNVGPKLIQEPGPKTRNGRNLQCMVQGVPPGDKISTALCRTPTATAPEAPALKPWQTWPRSKKQNEQSESSFCKCHLCCQILQTSRYQQKW